MRKQAVPATIRKKARFGSRRVDVVDQLRRGRHTVRELATQLRLTDNAVRSHLLALEEEGLVRREGFRPGTRRPHALYHFTPRAHKLLAHASDVSLSALLGAIKQQLPPEKLRKLLKGGGKDLAQRFYENGAKRPLRSRVQQAVRLLNELGGSASAERDAEGYRIRSQACPLTAVVAEHPETCLLVESFLSRLIGAPVRESCRRDAKPLCSFDIAAD